MAVELESESTVEGYLTRSLLGISLFAVLYLIAGVAMGTIGIIAYFQIPNLFTTGIIIWAGIVIFLAGILLLLMSISSNGEISLKKTYIMILLCLIVLIVSISCIVVMEMVDWKEVRYEAQDMIRLEGQNDDLIVFLTYLFSLLGSVVGLTTAFFGMVYIYVTISVPINKSQQYNNRRYDPRICQTDLKTVQHGQIKPPRNFNFKLSPLTERKQTTTLTNNNCESDMYHLSWVYDTEQQQQQQQQEQQQQQLDEEPPSKETSVKVDDQNASEVTIGNKALMAEIRQKVSSRKMARSTLNVTAQVNTIYEVDEPSEHHQPLPDLELSKISSSLEDPVRGRIGQLPANISSSFSRRPKAHTLSTKL